MSAAEVPADLPAEHAEPLVGEVPGGWVDGIGLAAPPCLAHAPPWPPPEGTRWVWPWPWPPASPPPPEALVVELRGLSDPRGPDLAPRALGVRPLGRAEAVAVPLEVLRATAPAGVRALHAPRPAPLAVPACAAPEAPLDLPEAPLDPEGPEARVGVAADAPLDLPHALPPSPAGGPLDPARELPGAALADAWERDLAALLGRPLVDLGGGVPVALARSATDPRWRAARWSWADLLGELTSCGTVDGPDAAEAKRRGPMWAPIDLGLDPEATAPRRGARPVGVSLLCLDLDGDCELVALAEAVRGWRHLWHTSPSHRPEAPRARLVLPLVEPVPLDRWPEVWAAAERWAAEALGLTVDPACKDIARGWFLPRVWAREPERLDWFAAGWAAEGRTLAWRWLIAEHGEGTPAAAPAERPEVPLDLAAPEGRTVAELCAEARAEAPDTGRRWARFLRARLDRACARLRGAGPGTRHDTLKREALALGGYLHLGGLSEREALAELAAAAVEAGKGAGEAHRTALDCLRLGQAQPLPVPEDRPRPRPEGRL